MSKHISLPPIETLQKAFEVSEESPSGLIWKYREGMPVKVNSRYQGKRAGGIRKSKDGYQYWVVRLDDQLLRAHRVVYALIHGEDPKGFVVDHKDGNGLNNTASNLRKATSSQNSCNSVRPSSNTTGFKGIFPRGKRWRAKVNHKGKAYFFGTHDTPENAYTAYLKGAKQLHGDFYHPG
jgi:hypothetical protein